MTAFEANNVYHVYTHANGSENLFRAEENYQYFLKKYAEYLHPVAETFAYCLMPNHLHLMVRVRGEGELAAAAEKHLQGFENLGGVVSQRFSNLFNAYTKAYNKRYARKGSLFQPNVKRKPILHPTYFTALIAYIHNNPFHHGFTTDPQAWPYSSWHAYLADKPTKLQKQEGLNWFGGKEGFIRQHQQLKARDVALEFD
jgi:putative transposase